MTESLQDGATGEPGITASRSSWRRLSWIAVLLGGIVAYAIVLWVMIITKNLNFFPALLLIGAVTVPITVLIFAQEGGRMVPVPTWAVVLTATVGGLVGVLSAGVLEYGTMRGLGAMPMLLVGLIEEASKLILPLLIYLVWRPTDPRGGVVIGVASGMGFASLETMGYGFQALLAAGNLGAVDGTLLLRGILSPACHIAWTGVTVAMLWRIRSARHRGRAMLAFVGTYLAAVILHAVWDGSKLLPVHIVVAVIGFVALLVFIHLAHRRHR
jgi:RsiW-degrading membrane proteinase PrsW (M82 family)